MSTGHAIFAPSRADQWAICAGSLVLSKDLPESPPTEYSASGTLTHLIAAARLTEPGTGPALGSTVTVDGFTFTVDQERIDRAESYVQNVRARGGVQFYEVELDMLPVYGNLGEPQGGTADAVVCLVDQARLEVHDLKDGVGIVEPTTRQLVCYAGAALFQYDYLCKWQDIEVYIHQPKVRAEPVSRRFTRAELLSEMSKLADAAQKANRMLLGLQPPEFTPGDKQCKWCPARGTCAARAQWIADQFPIAAQPAQLTDTELGELLNKRARIEEAFASWAAEALNRARLGSQILGWKLALGRQGNRKWNDAAFAERLLNATLAGDAYKRTLIDPPEAEKRLKKSHPAAWAELTPNIVRSEGQPILVPDADPRQPLSSVLSEFDVVDNATDLLGV